MNELDRELLGKARALLKKSYVPPPYVIGDPNIPQTGTNMSQMGMPTGDPNIPQTGMPSSDAQMMQEVQVMAQQMGVPVEQLLQMLSSEKPPEKKPVAKEPDNDTMGKLEKRIKNLELMNKLLLDKIDILLDEDIQKMSSEKHKNMLYYMNRLLRT